MVNTDTLFCAGNKESIHLFNYIITNLGEVPPLALEKLLAFSNGVKWKEIIIRGVSGMNACMLSKLTADEIKAIDLVIKTFGVYSPKTLELISHSQAPWIEKRIAYKDDEPGNEVIDETSLKKYFVDKQLNTEEKIVSYIMATLKI